MSSLQPFAVVINTDGTPEAVERARTVLNTSGVTSTSATSRTYVTATQTTRLIPGPSVPAHLGTFVAVTIAGTCLAVATGAAIIVPSDASPRVMWRHVARVGRPCRPEAADLEPHRHSRGPP